MVAADERRCRCGRLTAGDSVPRSLRGLVGLLSASAAAWTATRLLAVALPWFVLSTTGSATQTGLVVSCQMGPYVVAQVLCGPLIDRVGPKRISVAGDLVAMTGMIIAPLLRMAGEVPLWVLMVIMGVVGAADGPSNAAKAVFVPFVTRAARVPLERATGLTAVVERSALTVGPAVAGVVVAAFGGMSALWVTAALFGLGALIVSIALTDPDTRQTERAKSYVARLGQGAGFLREDRLLLSIYGMCAVTNLLDQAFATVLLPVWTKASGHGPETLGLLVSVFSVASIGAGGAAATFGHRLPRRAVFLAGFIIGGVPRFAVMALGVPLGLVLAVMVVGGLGSGFVNPIIGALTYERVPTVLLGRVKTLLFALAWSGIPLGGLLAGALTTLAGLSGALYIAGAGYLLAVALPGINKEWSHMNRSSGQEPQPLPQAHTAQT